MPDFLQIEVLREVTPEDLARPPVTLPVRTAAPQGLDRVKSIHHAQARLLASGKSPGEVCAMLGTSRSTLQVLLLDPAFQELQSYYKAQIVDIWAENQEKAALLARISMDEMQERLELAPEKVSFNQLRELAMTMLDRTDLPVKTATLQPNTLPVITFNFGGALGERTDHQTLEGHVEPPEEKSDAKE